MNSTSLVLPDDGASGARATPWVVQWLVWPTLFAGGLGAALHAIARQWSYELTYAGFLIATIATLVSLEFLFPLRERWRMTWRSFGRDLKYLAGGTATIAVVNAMFGLVALRLGDGQRVGLLTDVPLYVTVPAALLTVDFVQYWWHRAMHEFGGHAGRFLWRIHVAHHLPDRVYVFMHVAGHPLNGLIVRGFAMLLPLYFLGASAETVLMFNVVNSLQGLVSHCNVELRAGWFNYVFVGAELHRYHHSADPVDSKNYAVTLSLLDILFGTFRYLPERLPTRLGVADPDAYPDSNAFWQVMRLPFARPKAAPLGQNT